MFAQISHDLKFNKLETVLKSVFREGKRRLLHRRLRYLAIHLKVSSKTIRSVEDST